MTILDKWDITAEQLTEVVNANPSLYGMLLGYMAEIKLQDIIATFPEVSFIKKFDDHDRKKKGDLYVVYRGKAFDIESKSLQSKEIGYDKEAGEWFGKAQIDASDKRVVTLPNGNKLSTTLLLRDEFDILAINCYSFQDKWKFVYARNRDLPFSTYSGYSKEEKESLISSLVKVTWPPKPPFYSDLKILLDEMVEEGLGKSPEDI